MVVPSCGNHMNKLKYLLFSFLFITLSCEKEERCYTVEGKEIINGEYYFLLDNNHFYSSNRDINSGIPDPYGTGKVSKDTYNSVNIGEKYCN